MKGTVQMIVFGVNTHKRTHTFVALDAATAIGGNDERFRPATLAISAVDDGSNVPDGWLVELDP